MDTQNKMSKQQNIIAMIYYLMQLIKIRFQ